MISPSARPEQCHSALVLAGKMETIRARGRRFDQAQANRRVPLRPCPPVEGIHGPTDAIDPDGDPAPARPRPRGRQAVSAAALAAAQFAVAPGREYAGGSGGVAARLPGTEPAQPALRGQSWLGNDEGGRSRDQVERVAPRSYARFEE